MPLYRWFWRSARKYPRAVALECAGSSLTYGELVNGAEAVAGRLAAATGITSAVGLYADRTPASFIGYLAVQRLGATVVPLTPAWPRARMTEVARQADLRVALAGTSDAPVPLPVVPVSEHGTAMSAASARRLPAVPDGLDSTAYILFTSGSTGIPKGVPIRHRNISSYLSYMLPRYGLAPGSRVAMPFELTFDLSVLCMFAAWGSGATLVVPTRTELAKPPDFIRRRGVTHWVSVPSAIRLAYRGGLLRPHSMPGLLWSLFCGEQLSVRDARWWREAAPSSAIENIYGPTELTVSCTHFRLPPGDAGAFGTFGTGNGTVPIGSLHPGHEHVILSAEGRPADVGELCVRGPQRFDGYLDPAANADRFFRLDQERAVPLVGRVDNGAWYRTGDTVTRCEHGLVHLGRLDGQVKVRGYRIETGEIEAAIRDYPGVVDSVVVAAPAMNNETVLRAVYTGTIDNRSALLAGLRSRLPAYMVPATIDRLPAIPLTSNGKIDRKQVLDQLSTSP